LLLSAVVAEAAARFAEVVDDVPETPLPLLPSDDDVFERFLLEDIFFLLLLFASFSPWALRLLVPLFCLFLCFFCRLFLALKGKNGIRQRKPERKHGKKVDQAQNLAGRTKMQHPFPFWNSVYYFFHKKSSRTRFSSPCQNDRQI